MHALMVLDVSYILLAYLLMMGYWIMKCDKRLFVDQRRDQYARYCQNLLARRLNKAKCVLHPSGVSVVPEPAPELEATPVPELSQAESRHLNWPSGPIS